MRHWRGVSIRLILRTLKIAAVILLALVAGAVVYVYSRGMPVSQTDPSANNDQARDELFRSKRALFVGAHPDDIEFYSAGLVHLLRKHDVDVIYAIGTRGGKGRNGRAKARLEGLRTQHQQDAARIIGGARVLFYDYPDKDLPSHVQAFANDLRELILKEKPDIVFSWDPDYIYNPHPDHVAAAQASDIATPDTDARRCFYGTRRPNLWVGYGEDVFRLKLRSLRAHRTETPWPYFVLGKRFLTRKSTAEGAKIDARYAEVYRCSY